MDSQRFIIDLGLVRRLIAAQFPQWSDLPIRPVAVGGWDNFTFRLGEAMVVRMPSAAVYAAQVEKEQRWLPRLAPQLPLAIPRPLAVGEPGEGYPWRWSVCGWLEGEPAVSAPIADLCDFAATLAQFLGALQAIDPTGGPLAGPHSFFRGGALVTYDAQVRQAITLLKNKVDAEAITDLWEAALATTWHAAPVWVHGDIAAGNLLVQGGALTAVLDFGQLAVGDPACDLAIAWTLFAGESRNLFRRRLFLDDATWDRGRGWTLWKALIIAAGLTQTNAAEGARCWQIIDEIVAP
jgi:aminoglycoside phosphotransferase (APT) family kinase protein